MRESYYYLPIVFCLFSLFYFSTHVIKPLPVKTIISGSVLNPLNDSVKVYNDKGVFLSKLNYNNRFKMLLDIDSSAYFSFFHGVETTAMYVNPGDNIELTIDTEAFDETINYRNSEESTFLSQKYLITENQLDKSKNIYNLSDSLFNTLLDNFKFKISQELMKISNAEFVALEEEGIVNTLNFYRNRKLTLDNLPKIGAPASDFTYPNQYGDNVSLLDFKGKYVYVDVWATWCGPCIYQIPFLVELEKEYYDRDIVFLSVSIDDDKDREKWRDMLVEKNMGGTQLFASGGSEITQDYAIFSIPRFMLFDREGNVLDLYAPKPSQADEIRAVLEDLF